MAALSLEDHQRGTQVPQVGCYHTEEMSKKQRANGIFCNNNSSMNNQKNFPKGLSRVSKMACRLE